MCTRLRTIRKHVEVSAEAMALWMERQLGPALSVLRGAFGDSWSDFCEARIVRDGHPGRFRGIAKGDELHRPAGEYAIDPKSFALSPYGDLVLKRYVDLVRIGFKAASASKA